MKNSYNYGKVEIPLQSTSNRILTHEVRVRYDENEVQIKTGPPKKCSWETVKSSSREKQIRNQL